MIKIAIANEQKVLRLERAKIRAAVNEVLRSAGVKNAEISVAIVANDRIHEVNRDFLRHDYPTDVISFLLERDDDRLEGEIVASAEMAVQTAGRWKWPAQHELLLYIVHGMLHLVGYDDTTRAAANKMRRAERITLERLGVKKPAAKQR